jgi:hypothetical protein
MLSFRCPACSKVLKAPEVSAGRDGQCPCGASFVIPRQVGLRPTPRVVNHLEQPESGPDDHEDVKVSLPGNPRPSYANASSMRTFVRRRRKKSILLTGVAIAAGFVFAAVVIVLIIGAVAGPNARFEGENWTFRELHEHLNARGVRCDMMNARGGILLYPVGEDPLVMQGWLQSDLMPPGAVSVSRHHSSEDARHSAGDGTAAEKNYHWGHFSFYGDPEMIKRIAGIFR